MRCLLSLEEPRFHKTESPSVWRSLSKWQIVAGMSWITSSHEVFGKACILELQNVSLAEDDWLLVTPLSCLYFVQRTLILHKHHHRQAHCFVLWLLVTLCAKWFPILIVPHTLKSIDLLTAYSSTNFLFFGPKRPKAFRRFLAFIFICFLVCLIRITSFTNTHILRARLPTIYRGISIRKYVKVFYFFIFDNTISPDTWKFKILRNRMF